MRKFIVSDIHGLGNIYTSIISYIDNISEDENVELYINGDLIDRGLDSAKMLLDLKNRIQDDKYRIIYLGGNHELMMYKFLEKKKKGYLVTDYNDWYINGGKITKDSLYSILKDEDKVFEISEFVSNLKTYHKFDEMIRSKPIVLVHAASPLIVKDECNTLVKDLNIVTSYYVWAREDDPDLPFRCRIGNKDYFTIVGHTPNNNKYGYVYHDKGNFLNIDGGCSPYACGYFSYDHVPLVEVCDNYLKILTFNNNNEIKYGNYFDGIKSIALSEAELNNERKYLNHDFKPKKLIRLPNDEVGYED